MRSNRVAARTGLDDELTYGPREAAAMPGDNRGRSDDHQGRLPVRPGQPEADPEQPVELTDGRLRTGAMADSQLPPQG